MSHQGIVRSVLRAAGVVCTATALLLAASFGPTRFG